MSNTLNISKLSAMLRTKRGNTGLRKTSDDIGKISSSTLSRVENGKVPDMETFLHLCNWLEVSPSEFFIEESEPEDVDMPDFIEAHLRADKELAPETTEALVTMIKVAYQSARVGNFNVK